MANAFRETFEVFAKQLDAQASKSVAKMATEGRARILAEETARRGVRPDSVAAVDGKIGAPFESVKPDGTIFIAFDYRLEMIKVALDELRARAPLGPEKGGHYRDEFFVQLDGTGLDALALPTAEQLRKVRVITITNPMPYSRVLEFRDGKHIIESASRLLASEFGSLAKIRFTKVSLEGAYRLKHDYVQTGRRSARRDRKVGSEIDYPAITIEGF